MNELEEGNSLRIEFDRLSTIARKGQQVVPVVLQDADSPHR
jgi:hypothetical protein